MKTIFVCTGNTCRSPLAESYARSLYNRNEFESRGIMVGSSEVSRESQRIIEEHVLPEPSAPKQLTAEDVEGNLLLTMTESHKMHIKQLFPEADVHTLAEYTTGEAGDVADPFGGSGPVYDSAFNEIKHYINLLHKGESS